MDNILLNNPTSKMLYEEIKNVPIIDYHNHLSAKEIYENTPFTNISHMWLDHDHYKWRLMRFSGFQTHHGNDYERFHNYIKALEFAYGNPLLIWSQMELKEVFGISLAITSENSLAIYELANTYLNKHSIGPRELLEKFNVKALCTTNDLLEDLRYHQLLHKENYAIKVLPTFRPDRLFTFDSEVLFKLEEQTNIKIHTISDLKNALRKRMDYFEQAGCKLADHGITQFRYEMISDTEAEERFAFKSDATLLRGYLLKFLFEEYSKRNWTVQLHIGALRNQNDQGFIEYGVDSGYDSISGDNFTKDLNAFFNDCNNQFAIPRTIVYPLNPNHYEEVASICGNFSTIDGHLQLGAAWWMNDHVEGIQKQLEVFMNYLNISKALGMLTDSRSFLSFVRHDYYRRILCNFIGDKVEQGLIPNHTKRLIKVVTDIAYNNSRNYLQLM